MVTRPRRVRAADRPRAPSSATASRSPTTSARIALLDRRRRTARAPRSLVDAIQGQRQVVIKGLEDNYGRVRGVAAATILGDGAIALILDAADLVANAIRPQPPHPSTDRTRRVTP